jgi:CheY-like chemotaxis protein
MNAVFSSAELAGIKALIVDDDDPLRETMVDFLEMFGVEVFTAKSGHEGFRVFREHRPAIVISDIEMPDGTGLDLARQIRTLPAEEGGLTPAIAVSARRSPRECFEAGFHCSFGKPFELLELLDAIRDFVRSGTLGLATWSVTPHGPADVLMRFDDYVTGADMRAAVGALAEAVGRSQSRHRVIVDLRKLTGFDPSVGLAAQTVAWQIRQRLLGGVIVGGSRLSHLVALGTCLILGIGCQFEDDVPPPMSGPVAAET